MIITDALTDSSLFRRLDTLERQVAGLTDLLAEEQLAMKLLEERLTDQELAIKRMASGTALALEAIRGIINLQGDALTDTERRLHALESAITPPTIFSFAPTLRDATSIHSTLEKPETP